MYLSSSFDSKKSDSTDDCNTSSTSASCANCKICFPPTPRQCKSANNTSCSVSCQSDSSASDGRFIVARKRNKKKSSKSLPPIGVFWDIENCQVPRNKSATIVVQRIREFFFGGYREAEFIVVCDVKKENPQVIHDLHDAQVNLIHVLSTSKNAADEKLRQSLRRFAETHPAPATVVLISGDINFAADLSDLRYRKKLHVILVHNTNVADALILCANETYSYITITDNLPSNKKNNSIENVDIFISNLPPNYKSSALKKRLLFLSSNTGGKVVDVNTEQGTAILRLSSNDFAIRAQRRLNGEDVYGKKIVVSNVSGSWRSHTSPHTIGRKVPKSVESASAGYSRPQTPPSFSVQDTLFKKQQPKELNWRESSREESGLNVPHWQPLPIPKSYRKNQNDNSTHDAVQFNSDKMFSSASASFQPIQKTSKQMELVITNLDPFYSDLRNVLLNLLKEHAIIYNLSLNNNQDGSPVAIVKVGSQQDAHNIISKMHHYKLGNKRLSISYAQTNGLDSEELKEMVIMLLKEAPLNSMPLYRLLNLLEKRFLISVSVYEVNKLREVCRIVEENGERIISLTAEFRSSPLPSFNRVNILLCSFHCPNGLMNSFGMDDSDDGEAPETPHINMLINEFAPKLNLMINSHNGTLPLLSFGICYNYEFGENLPLDSSGVPLEHLITCVNNVRLKYGGPNKNTKYIIRDFDKKPGDAEKEGLDKFMKTLSQGITSNIALLSREMVDLLKTTEKCQLQLNKFIPAYHHHFGRQLRVADYGFTKLSDLLYSQLISNVVQIIGEGNKRTITLTHSTQMRRFTSDLLRVLKNQASKQLQFNEFSAAYERVLSKSFNPIEYGLCSFEDLLSEVPENTILISSDDENVYIAIPKREQTIEEILCTKQFADEVIKLLSYTPQCSILFNKFVPAYHHHFGHQCRVSDYGFTKLIELFEAIPDTVKIEENSDGERKVSLTLNKALAVRGNQIAELIKKSHLSYLPLEALASSFYREYGYILKPYTYECLDINELVTKLSDHIKVSYSNAGPLLIPVASDSQSILTLRVWALLINPPHQLHLSDLIKMYNNHFQSNIALSSLEKLNNVIINKIKESETNIFLTPPYATAAKIYLLLYKEGGQVAYNSLNNLFTKYYGISLLQKESDTFENLFSDFSFLIIMRRTRKRTNIILNPKVKEYGLSLPNSESLSNNFYMKYDDNVSWPPPPVHNLVFKTNNVSAISPPKPDTPPPPGSAPWKNWETPPKFNSEHFTVSLPSPKAPTFLLHPNSLISPTKSLLSANSYNTVSPPEPGALPIPDKLLKKGVVSDDSTDSGVNNSNITSENEMDMSCDLNAQTRMKSSL